MQEYPLYTKKSTFDALHNAFRQRCWLRFKALVWVVNQAVDSFFVRSIKNKKKYNKWLFQLKK